MAITNIAPGAKVPDACAQKFKIGSKAYIDCKAAISGAGSGSTPTQAPPGAQVPPKGGGPKY